MFGYANIERCFGSGVKLARQRGTEETLRKDDVRHIEES
jgi:hypothetical protein